MNFSTFIIKLFDVVLTNYVYLLHFVCVLAINRIVSLVQLNLFFNNILVVIQLKLRML